MSQQPYTRLSAEEKFDLCLQRFPALQKMENVHSEQLRKKMQFKSLDTEQIAYEPGWECDHFFMCLTGKTRVFKRSESGREILLYHVNKGETCVLTTSCLITGQSFPANSIAEQETHLAAIPANTFTELLSISPDFRSFVLDNYGLMLSSLITLVDQIAFDRTDQRLAKLLIKLSDEQGIVNCTHNELALDLGSVREVISRQLQDWESRGFVRTKRGRIEILEAEDLARHTQGSP